MTTEQKSQYGKIMTRDAIWLAVISLVIIIGPLSEEIQAVVAVLFFFVAFVWSMVGLYLIISK